MATGRMRRVNEVVREVLAESIGKDLHDPGIGFVTVTGVDTSPDLRSARVYVSVLGSPEEQEETIIVLGESHAILQRAIATQLRMKRTPTLTFTLDHGPEEAARLTAMIDEETGEEE